MSVGKGILSVRARTIKNAAEVSVGAHSDWQEECDREEAIADVLRAIEGGALAFVTNRGRWRDKIQALKEKEIKKAIAELARAKYVPAMIALNYCESEQG